MITPIVGNFIKCFKENDIGLPIGSKFMIERVVFSEKLQSGIGLIFMSGALIVDVNTEIFEDLRKVTSKQILKEILPDDDKNM